MTVINSEPKAKNQARPRAARATSLERAGLILPLRCAQGQDQSVPV